MAVREVKTSLFFFLSGPFTNANGPNLIFLQLFTDFLGKNVN